MTLNAPAPTIRPQGHFFGIQLVHTGTLSPDFVLKRHPFSRTAHQVTIGNELLTCLSHGLIVLLGRGGEQVESP